MCRLALGRRFFGAALLLIVFGVSMTLFIRPRGLTRVFDLLHPGEGLYRPVVVSEFDFWTDGNEREYPLDCEFSGRDYEISLSVPPERIGKLPNPAQWPDLGGRFQLILETPGEPAQVTLFDGQADSVNFDTTAGEHRATLLRLATFFVADCEGAVVRLRVVEAATDRSFLQPRPAVVLRVSPAI